MEQTKPGSPTSPAHPLPLEPHLMPQGDTTLKESRLSIPALLCAALLGVGIATAQQPAPPAPVPPAITAAKSIFVSNGGADSGLFPEPFSGDPDRPYNELFASLMSSGQFRLVTDPALADLVLEIRLLAPNGPTNPNKQNGAAYPLPMFRLTVYDAKSRFLLWTITDSVGFAYLQKTHDRNFDMALNGAVSQFLRIAGKPPLPAASAP